MAFLGEHPGFAREPLDGRFADTPPADDFTAHVFSCALAIAFSESQDESVGLILGLTGAELSEITENFVPEAIASLALRPQPERIDFDEEEEQLRALFLRYRGDDSRETGWLTSVLARRCMSPNHLWQDLGFHSRGELNRLIRERFPALAGRNAHNMKWKKFFYRCLCELEGFTLCAAPSCSECADYAACFGEERGLARIAPEPSPHPLRRSQ